ncbi:peptidoglycan DD-metalloendopeptidase family protein [Flavobacterium pallidum]|uniref:Peptidase M23 n=1 Tax=Flavobacterium pallidum TaxID=2172098 RepID=A0A2S1SJK8_9FLAO|nr:peptidoglycan DD-metalloendopeptidase family protein [Flavobacterium pallidum]AWI26539.1 peptidase M23 [Flavobacterium pallidum]
MTIFENFLYDIQKVKVLDNDIHISKYVAIDLSEKQTDHSRKFLEDPNHFQSFIDDYLRTNNALVAYGGYNEKRTLYHHNELFNDEESAERNMHIGFDFWAKAGTKVVAPLDATVHSFDYNTGEGNYGPTVILEHQIDGHHFYTLYGHLSIESIENIEIGDHIGRNQVFASIGDMSVNGNYAPHLHFQIIIDLEGYFGDYPGVSSEDDLPHYLKNCPDPDLLFKLSTP